MVNGNNDLKRYLLRYKLRVLVPIDWSTQLYKSDPRSTHTHKRQAGAIKHVEKSNTVRESKKGNRVTQTVRERTKEKEQNKNGNEIQHKKKSKRVRKIENNKIEEKVET